MGKHTRPNPPREGVQAGHHGRRSKPPRCHTCRLLKSKCRCQRFDNGPAPKETSDA
jgi:hypothetical protein